MLKMRASSITSAVPEPSSLAASPQPWPSMCAPTMYISSGRVDADLGAVDLLRARRRRGRLAVERAQLFVGLLHRVVVDAGTRARAARPSAALRRSGLAIRIRRALRPRARLRGRRRRRGVVVVDAFDVGAAVALELRFDPVDRLAIALGALASIAELRQALDGRLVALEIEPADQRLEPGSGGLGGVVGPLWACRVSAVPSRPARTNDDEERVRIGPPGGPA